MIQCGKGTFYCEPELSPPLPPPLPWPSISNDEMCQGSFSPYSVKNTFGKHMNNPALTKLPAWLLEDFSPGGALCYLMAVSIRIKTDQLWRHFHFHCPSGIDRGIELFMSIHKDLTLCKGWLPHKVLIHFTVRSTLMAKLVDIVKRHQVGKMVARESDRERKRDGGGGGGEGRYQCFKFALIMSNHVGVSLTMYDVWLTVLGCGWNPTRTLQWRNTDWWSSLLLFRLF